LSRSESVQACARSSGLGSSGKMKDGARREGGTAAEGGIVPDVDIVWTPCGATDRVNVPSPDAKL
jgi:hypothetical protein